jgi:hypothetical protein
VHRDRQAGGGSAIAAPAGADRAALPLQLRSRA